MNTSVENVPKDNAPQTPHLNSDDGVRKTPEDAVKEPLTPVPAIDEINPPLEATLGGGDDVVTPTEKK